MELNKQIITRLNEIYPNKTFQLLGKTDPTSYTTRYVLTVEGRETPYGYIPVLYDRFIKEHDWTENMCVEHFVAGAKGLIFL
jgi:hypothetical protein